MNGWRVAPGLHQPGQHDIGVERAVAFDDVAFPVQPQLLPGQVLHQQSAQLVFVEAVELVQQVGSAHGCPCFLGGSGERLEFRHSPVPHVV